MKLRHLLERIGIKRPAQTYGHTKEEFDLGRYGRVRFAQWNHPKCRRTVLETAPLDELRKILSPGDAVLDIGAHTGDTSVLFAAAVGSTGRVFAVEPNSFAVAILDVNAALNSEIAPIEVMPYAAVETPGKLVFNYSDAGYCNGGDFSWIGSTRHNHLYQLDVDGRNIADELQAHHADWIARIRLIKSDTEGSDAAVMRSLRSIIEAHRPYIVCEVYRHQTPERREELFALLHDELGYTIHRADLWHELRGEEVHDRTLSGETHFDIFCVPN